MEYPDSESFFASQANTLLADVRAENGNALTIEEIYQHFYDRLDAALALKYGLTEPPPP